MAQPKIFIFTPNEPDDPSHDVLTKAGCRLELGESDWFTPHQLNDEDRFWKTSRDAHAVTGVMIRACPISRKVMEQAPDLRIIAKYTIGVDDVDVDAATELGIMVTHCPTESNWGGVAEGTMAMILVMLKKTRQRDRQVKDGAWRDPSLAGIYLGRRQDGYEGITLGIVGLGRIGSRLADLLGPWRVRLLACDPYVDLSKFVHHNVEKVDMDTLLRESDVVTLHTNLTSETRGMITAEKLALMKPTALLINTSRGPVINQDDLFDALDKEVIAGAALDVFPTEPPEPQTPLLGLGDKVLLSPHMVSSSFPGGLRPGVDWATRSLLTALKGDVPDNVYNKEVIPAWSERFGGNSLF